MRQKILTICLLALFAAVLWMPSSVMAACGDDQKLCPANYYTLTGLDGREGVCDGAHTIPGATCDRYMGLKCENCSVETFEDQCIIDYCGGVGAGCNYNETSGAVGVSQYVSYDKTLAMAGSIQALYDDASTADCTRKTQVYTIVQATGKAFPGLTNSGIGLKLSQAGAEVGTWSTMHAQPNLSHPLDYYDNFEEDLNCGTVNEKDNVGIDFPADFDSRMNVMIFSPNPVRNMTRYAAIKEATAEEDKDIIEVTQWVYKPEDKPYFNITWKLESNNLSYTEGKFWHFADTFTSFSDHGYGYLCDVTKVAGGTGGSAFFQGTIALHPSAKQFEGWWAKVFKLAKDDDLPEFVNCSNPNRPVGVDCSAGPMDPGTEGYVPLTKLDDNAIVHEWQELEIDAARPQYVSVRWTFDDPILQSTYGSARSLFVVSPDVAYKQDPTDKEEDPVEVDSTLHDINFDLSKWRGAMFVKRIPKSCTYNSECTITGESCLDSPECSGQTGCPKYCALTANCGDGLDESCDGSETCVFGFCIEKVKWKTENLANTTTPAPAARKIFTFDTEGNRYAFTAANATALNEQFGYDSSDEASDLISWTLGSLNSGNDASSRIIPDESELDSGGNASHDYDMHNPVGEVSYNGAGGSYLAHMMRERYDEDSNDRWLLGDITHADPIFIGSRPSNSWTDIAGNNYSDFYNSDQYLYRKPILLVVANDGMIHCYNAETGEEIWAFSPWDVLPNLPKLAQPFYEQLRSPIMDLRPVVHDAFDSSANAGAGAWKTVLILGSRGGGDHYWALDITSPLYLDDEGPEFMWYYSDDDLGLTYSVPTTGRFLTGGDGSEADPFTFKWLVFFGSGYARHSAAQIRKVGYFYTLDMFDEDPGDAFKAKTIAKMRVSAFAEGGSASIYGVEQVGNAGDPDRLIRNNVLSSPVVMDSDSDGFEDVVYIGDLAGHLLRFTFSGNIDDVDDVKGHVLFNTYMEPFGDGSGDRDLTYYKTEVQNTRLLCAQGQAAANTQTYAFYKYPRPISVQPVVWRTTDPGDSSVEDILGDPDNKDKVMVFFGTGKFDAFYDSFDDFSRLENGTSVTDHQEMFAVIDHMDTSSGDVRVEWDELRHNHVEDEAVTAIVKGQSSTRVLRTIVEGSIPTDCRGWRLELNSNPDDFPENKGEKVITRPVVWEQQNLFKQANSDSPDTEWILFFTTFTPNMQGTCDLRWVDEAGGGFLMSVKAENGGNPAFLIQDVTGDSILDEDEDSDDSGTAYAGQKFTGSVLSKVDVDPFSQVMYVKTGTGNPVMRIRSAGMPDTSGARTAFYRVQ